MGQWYIEAERYGRKRQRQRRLNGKRRERNILMRNRHELYWGGETVENRKNMKTGWSCDWQGKEKTSKVCVYVCVCGCVHHLAPAVYFQGLTSFFLARHLRQRPTTVPIAVCTHRHTPRQIIKSKHTYAKPWVERETQGRQKKGETEDKENIRKMNGRRMEREQHIFISLPLPLSQSLTLLILALLLTLPCCYI